MICEAPPEAKFSQSVDECVHRAAYKYARSPGTNSELAKAVRKECKSEILESARGITDAKQKQFDRHGTAYSESDYSEGLDQAHQYAETSAEDEALRRIVQAKAGKCDPPKQP